MTALNHLGAVAPKNLMMVTYDLRQQGQNYDVLINALQSLGALRVQLSTWWVATTHNDTALRDYLQTFIDGNDSIIVGHLSSVSGYEGVPEIRVWIEEYLKRVRAA